MDVTKVLKSYGLPETITGTCPIEHLERNKLAYVERTKFIKHIKPNKKAIILARTSFKKHVEGIQGNTYIYVEDPITAFVKVHNAFYQDRRDFKKSISPSSIHKDCEIHPTAVIGGGVTIKKGAVIGAYVVIGNNVDIGEHTILHPHITIMITSP